MPEARWLEIFLKLSDNDSSSGDQFTACGKTWKVGPKGYNWHEAQDWINGLGGGWHTPTLAELKELYSSVGRNNSMIGGSYVWSTSDSDYFAWVMDYSGERTSVKDIGGDNILAVAVISH